MDTKDETHNKETHGRNDDIDVNTPISKVKGPNVFERAKEEIEAIVDALHLKKDGKQVSSNTKEKANEGTGSTVHKDKVHKSETHGMSDDIDEKTPIHKVKGPNIFERAKEEIEAIVDAIHPKKGE